jgi:hypothetical protein
MKNRQGYRYGLHCAAAMLLASCGSQVAPVGGGNAAGVDPVPANEHAAAAAPFFYDEICEASAAAVLDDRHFAVASDEMERLQVYRRGQARPVAHLDHEDVTDIEGAVRIRDTVFWLTSHSLNSGGVDKPKRKVFFASKVVAGPTLAEAGANFVDLRARVAAQLGIAETALMPWLNIEGVAATQAGDLLIGLRRAPAGEARAYVLSIGDPFVLVGLRAAAGAPAPARTWRLDLGGRGIRSLERVGTGARSYLILAGPREDEALSFALFWWDGESEAVTPGPAVAFGDMSPEAMILWPDGELQILGDNEGDGPARCTDKEDPHHRPRRFPSISLRL